MTRWLFCLLLLFTASVSAKQLQFKRQDLGDQIQFDYVWLDHQSQERQLSVKLDKRKLLDSFRSFKLYKPQLANQHIMMALQQRASTADPREANIKIRRISNQITIDIQSREQQYIDKWQKILAQTKEDGFQRYLDDNFYVEFTDTMRVKGIKPDHVKFARESTELVAPIAAGLHSMMVESVLIRERINLLLSWIQSIPYDTLENRLSSNGSGYAPPGRLIDDNRGDCDSKTVLMAALLHAIDPRIKMVYLFLPEHALLGIQLPLLRKERFFEYQGQKYLYVEPTGPAMIPVSEASNASLRAINNGQVTFEPVTF